MNTRKYPRTMTEAFGPYTDNKLHEPDCEPGDFKDELVFWGSTIAGLAALAIMLIWG